MGGGIPCRPNPAATLLVVVSVLIQHHFYYDNSLEYLICALVCFMIYFIISFCILLFLGRLPKVDLIV